MDTYLDVSFGKFNTVVTDSAKLHEEMFDLHTAFYKKHDPQNVKKFNRDEFPFVIIEIQDGKATALHIKKDDERVVHAINMIKRALIYCAGRPVPNTKLFFWISDRVPWELGENADKYPFFVHAKPRNTLGVLFPDNFFSCITLQKKYSGDCHDWDQMKKLFAEKNKLYREKQKIIYFKGTPTTKKIHKLREVFAEYAKNKKHMLITLDGWSNYRPVTDSVRYLFLLNLPGHYPWSNRFKYLFLTGSVVININVLTKSIVPGGWDEDEYVSFMDLIMVPNVDYINLSMTYYNAGISADKAKQAEAEKKTRQEVNRIIKEIESIYSNYAANKAKYDAMIQSYTKKIQNLNNAEIYEYIYGCIVHNARLIK